MSDREFWTLIYRAVMMIASAIKKRYLGSEEKTAS